MAAGFLRQVAGDRLDVFTAGIQPVKELQPLAVKIMGLLLCFGKTSSLALRRLLHYCFPI